MKLIRAGLPAAKLMHTRPAAKKTGNMTRRGLLTAGVVLPLAATLLPFATSPVATPYPSTYGAQW